MYNTVTLVSVMQSWYFCSTYYCRLVRLHSTCLLAQGRQSTDRKSGNKIKSNKRKHITVHWILTKILPLNTKAKHIFIFISNSARAEKKSALEKWHSKLSLNTHLPVKIFTWKCEVVLYVQELKTHHGLSSDYIFQLSW